jgi:hypothetical protein
MKGDRVRISDTTLFEDQNQNLVVYQVRRNPDGSLLFAGDGSVLIESVGGVRLGSTGVINGNPVRVHRSQLKSFEAQHGAMANDFINLLPVWLDTYQQEGWFPADHVKVVAGGVAR